MMNFNLSREQELVPALITKIIEKHQQTFVPKYIKMDKYYHCQNDINGRIITDANKPNNKISHPYANYITDTLTGYFMGEGLAYSSLDETSLDELKMILEYNDAADEDMELAKDMSIFGVAVELQYVDEDGNVRFRRLNPTEIVLVYDDTLEEDLLYGIRYYQRKDLLTDKETWFVEVYSDTDIKYYRGTTLSALSFVEEKQHFFGLCPISVFFNNEEQIGDFENVISLIDAYDKIESDSLNDFEYFVDAYLMLTGLNADSDDIAAMKENRVILLDPDSDAKWLIKDTNDTNIENVKTRLDEDIHKFAKVPNMSDESFSGNASGVAIKYKTLSMENVVSIKERKFKKALQRRIELIFNILNLKGAAYDWRSIEITFTRNLPTNDSEIAQMVATLNGIVSDETLLAQIPFITDVTNEIERLNEQKQANIDAFYNQDFVTETEEQEDE